MRHSRFLTTLTSLLLATGAAWAAGDGAHGERHSRHTLHQLSSADMETYDLSELADGERREFGTAEHTIVAERSGDVVTVTMPSRDGDAAKTFECRIGGDSCIVKLLNGDDKHKMLLIKKSGDGSAEDREMIVKTLSGDHSLVWIDHEGNDFEMKGDNAVFIGEGDHANHKVRVMRMHGDSGRVLKVCPEGDTRMALNEDEADVAYTCPKHGLELVQRDLHKMMQNVIEIREIEGAPED